MMGRVFASHQGSHQRLAAVSLPRGCSAGTGILPEHPCPPVPKIQAWHLHPLPGSLGTAHSGGPRAWWPQGGRVRTVHQPPSDVPHCFCGFPSFSVISPSLRQQHKTVGPNETCLFSRYLYDEKWPLGRSGALLTGGQVSIQRQEGSNLHTSDQRCC